MKDLFVKNEAQIMNHPSFFIDSIIRSILDFGLPLKAFLNSSSVNFSLRIATMSVLSL